MDTSKGISKNLLRFVRLALAPLATFFRGSHNKMPASANRLPDWVKPGGLLGVFSLAFIFGLAITFELTKDRVAEQERLKLRSQLQELLAPGSYDNAPDEDIFIDDAAERVVYRARKQQQPVAALLHTVAPDGYSGSISLLVGVAIDGELLGVRVLNHNETPGLGDAIDLRRSNWVLDFTGRSLNSLSAEQWAVKKDGGVFDSFTGATITPRAVVNEVKETLVYYQQNRQEIFR